MTGSLFVLLPPSEGKQTGGSAQRDVDTFAHGLGDARRDVLAMVEKELAVHDDAHVARLLNVRGPLLERARASFDALSTSSALYLPAWRRYSGVVWQHLEPETLTEAQRRTILVPSGLYGVTTALDDVADYRLRMNARLGGLGVLSSFWRPLVGPEIVGFVRGATVVDLLTNEHRAAIDFDLLREVSDVVTARFLDASGERAVGHDAKAVKGFIARLVVSEGLSSVASIRWRGWRVRVKKGAIEAMAPRPT